MTRPATIVGCAVLLGFTPSAGYPCSCAGYDSAAQALEYAEVAARGAVVEVGNVDAMWHRVYVHARSIFATLIGWDDDYFEKWYWSSRYGTYADIAVLEGFKGQVEGTFRVQTGFGDGDCGMPFLEGVEYLVFAQRVFPEDGGDSYLMTDFCIGTLRIDHAEEDLTELRELLDSDSSVRPEPEEHTVAEELANEALQQTRPAVTTHGAVFAAERRCSADLPVTTDDGMA